jgi:hypothetical protein
MLQSQQATPEYVEDLTDLPILAMRERLGRIGRFDPPHRRVEDMAVKAPKFGGPIAKPASTGSCAPERRA